MSLLSKPISRRGLMKAAPGVAVASQQVVASQVKKAASQAALAERIALSSVNLSSQISDGPSPVNDSPWQRVHRAAIEMMRAGKIPDHKLAQIELDAGRRARLIDPDIEAMISLSEVKKRQMQYERSKLEVIKEYIMQDDADQKFNSLFTQAEKAMGGNSGL